MTYLLFKSMVVILTCKFSLYRFLIQDLDILILTITCKVLSFGAQSQGLIQWGIDTLLGPIEVHFLPNLAVESSLIWWDYVSELISKVSFSDRNILWLLSYLQSVLSQILHHHRFYHLVLRCSHRYLPLLHIRLKDWSWCVELKRLHQIQVIVSRKCGVCINAAVNFI